MAIAPTGAIYKALKFDGVSSRTYGVYITGEAVYNAPEREVEMISIPGRNGAFALDKGRFENVTVTYPAGIFADNETDFAAAISDFRNYLCSRKGYCRLTDEYNPNEYRMAVYKSGLEVDPAQLRAGEFEITFDCKPQRWLTSGETAVTIASSGDTITNPTLFESGPLLEVEGYGKIEIEGQEIDALDVPVGEIQLSEDTPKFTPLKNVTNSFTIDTSNLIVGDRIYAKASGLIYLGIFRIYQMNATIISTTVTSSTNCISAVSNVFDSNHSASFRLGPDFTGGFIYGTASTITASMTTSVVYTQGTDTVVLTANFAYDGANTIDFSFTITGINTTYFTLTSGQSSWLPAFYGDSSKSAVINPRYIDLDVGEVYGYSGGVLLPLNNTVIIPAKLPTLAPGSNAITYDNTITDLKVTPRWWKV